MVAYVKDVVKADGERVGHAEMEAYKEANRDLWNAWTALHEQSEFYNSAAFKAGKSTLRPIERAELGDMRGKTLLHLMCHFGLDTLSWARHAAVVTGVDLSEQAIALASSLSREVGLAATFVQADLDHLPTVLSGQFDIVFTSYGVLHWLPNLERWATVIAHFLRPGGVFYMVETHPFMRVFPTNSAELRVSEPYFYTPEPYRFEARGSYAAPAADGPARPGYMWDHSLGEVVTALAGAGLHLEYLHEFPYAVRAVFPDMEQGEDGYWRLRDRPEAIPLLFSLRATRP